MRIKFWGTRGSIPVPGKNTLKYGGNTPCIEIYNGGDEITIIDAGSGIRELGIEIIKNPLIKKINILISHFHWDHIQGLPFFTPIYNKDYEINFYSSRKKIVPNENIFDVLMQPLFFPVTKKVLNAKINFHGIKEGESFNINGFEISTVKTHHSLGTVSFKLSNDKVKFVYLTDSEIFYDADNNDPDINLIKKHNSDIIDFCRGCNYLVHDTMYSIKDFKEKVGWGHSNNISAAILAAASDSENLMLFHYEPRYTDKMIDSLLSETKKFIKKMNYNFKCAAAKDYMEIKI
ncbi:MAG: MBL fold metallo-hydrolase [Bacteroidetes bacterium]|nr:MBL fold metallo-hydrolase [Bacteroidota bacterium]